MLKFDGKRLRRKRTAHPMSLRQFARAMKAAGSGRGRQTLLNYEAEETNPDFDVVSAMSHVLGCEIVDLCKGQRPGATGKAARPGNGGAGASTAATGKGAK